MMGRRAIIILLSSIITAVFLAVSLLCWSMLFDVTVYADTLTLYKGAEQTFNVPDGARVEISNGNVLKLFEKTDGEGHVTYSVIALQDGYCSVSVSEFFGGCIGTRTTYYDVFVLDTFNALAKIELRRTDTGETVLVRDMFGVKKTVLEFGAEYEVLLNDAQMATSDFFPCTVLHLADYSSDGIRRKNLVLNEEGNIEVRGAKSGSFVIYADVIGSVKIDYEVGNNYISIDDIVASYNAAEGTSFTAEELTTEMATELLRLNISTVKGLEVIRQPNFKNVFPNVAEIMINVGNDEINRIGIVELPKQIEKVVFSSAVRDPSSYAVVEGAFKCTERPDLHVVYDGYIKMQHGVPESAEKKVPMFAGYRDLTVESKNGYLNLTTDPSEVPISVFGDITTLRLYVRRPLGTYGDTRGYYGMGIKASNGNAICVNGADAVVCEELYIHVAASLSIRAGDGADGQSGLHGWSYEFPHGAKGYNGGNGGCAVKVNHLFLNEESSQASISLYGGNGGKGGRGGNGRDGKDCTAGLFDSHNASDGGNAGDGGDGGSSGYALWVGFSIQGKTELLFYPQTSIVLGAPGEGGDNGIRGDAGECDHWFHKDSKDGAKSQYVSARGLLHEIYYCSEEFSKAEFFAKIREELAENR